MSEILTLVFLGGVAYVIHCMLVVCRRAWSATSGKPVRQVLVGISPGARRGFRIAGRVALAITVALGALYFLALMALSSAEF